MERISSILLVAGLGCFGLASILTGYLPVSHLGKIQYKSLEEVTPEPTLDFIDLSRRYPEQFKRYYGAPTVESFRKALVLGRDTYVAEACWHCHSQYVRPVSNEDQRFGKISYAAEYRNAMFLPHLFGTRRVGPDLIREAGRHGNDWHAAHFFDPTLVSPASVMPRYTWFFDGEQPNDRGIAIITYMQWLGSWATPEALAREAAAAAAASQRGKNDG
jgi:cbb3-type cytochrome c oxidase subunit II